MLVFVVQCVMGGSGRLGTIYRAMSPFILLELAVLTLILFFPP